MTFPSSYLMLDKSLLEESCTVINNISLFHEDRRKIVDLVVGHLTLTNFSLILSVESTGFTIEYIQYINSDISCNRTGYFVK